MARPSLAVVIPTLNEADLLKQRLAELERFSAEVVVADGDSRDGTPEVARRSGARLVTARGGRGPQLNAGAAAARADGLLFLHADTRLPAEALPRVEGALADGFVGGGFLLRFDAAGGWFDLGAGFVNRRTRWWRSPLGDQAQFSSRSAFERVGGFPDWPILEDLEFIRRLRRQGPIAVLEPPVETSARRFVRRGPARAVARNWAIFTLFWLGVSPRLLRHLYRPEPPASERPRRST